MLLPARQGQGLGSFWAVIPSYERCTGHAAAPPATHLCNTHRLRLLAGGAPSCLARGLLQ